MFSYKFNGVELSMGDMATISNFYRVASTAEYLLDNYKRVTDKNDALYLARKIRELMEDSGYSEEEAVEKVMSVESL